MVKIDTPTVDLAELSKFHCAQFVPVSHGLLTLTLRHFYMVERVSAGRQNHSISL